MTDKPAKYIATVVEDDEVNFFSYGTTPEIALAKFESSGELENYADYAGIDNGSEVKVYVYTWVTPEESDFDEEELDPYWAFVLKDKVSTVSRVINRSA
jgi:hypothetical protein